MKRNRIKRQMREVVRLLLKENRIKSGFMMAILAKPLVLEKEHGEIEKSVVDVLNKAKLIT